MTGTMDQRGEKSRALFGAPVFLKRVLEDKMAKEVFMPKAGMDMQELLDGVQTMFAGGNIPQEDKDLFFEAVMRAYMETKQDAKARFTPNKFKGDHE